MLNDKFIVTPITEPVTGENDVVRIDKHWTTIQISDTTSRKYAVVVCFKTATGHHDEILKVLIVPKVKSHEDALGKVESKKERLSGFGDWADHVGISLFKGNRTVNIPQRPEECELTFWNGVLKNDHRKNRKNLLSLTRNQDVH